MKSVHLFYDIHTTVTSLWLLQTVINMAIMNYVYIMYMCYTELRSHHTCVSIYIYTSFPSYNNVYILYFVMFY